MDRQSVNMVVVGNFAAEKRGKVSGEESEAGFCVKVFCCQTCLVLLFV